MKVKMINSVGEFVAGEDAEVPDEEGDRFILLGYAEGQLSRNYDEQEQQALLGTAQSVSL